MTSRKCFPCTACCEGWLTSAQIGMHPGKPCQHCTQQGCAIYETRPQIPCISFRCGWLTEPSAVPENMRPDQCGAIIMLGKKWKGQEIISAAPSGEEIPAKTMDWLMAYARAHSLPLLFSKYMMPDGKWEATKYLGYGPLWFVQAVENEILPEDITTI